MSMPMSRRQRRTRVVLGDEHRSQVARRTAAAVRMIGQAVPASTRIATALPGYLLAHTSSDIVRQCELLSPLPAPGEVRVVATPARSPGEWHLDIAGRDRPGLLAAFTGVLVDSEIDVIQAVLATWDDGAALQALVIRSADPPQPATLQHAFAASLDEPLSSPPIADAHVTFDDAAPTLYTRCDVAAADRPGLLHAIAVALATTGADIHAARVTTIDGVAHDRFDLSDRTGAKLDTTLEDTIRASIRGGVDPARRGRRIGTGALWSRRA
jgi:[protein-PII] uridylyltransferase